MQIRSHVKTTIEFHEDLHVIVGAQIMRLNKINYHLITRGNKLKRASKCFN